MEMAITIDLSPALERLPRLTALLDETPRKERYAAVQGYLDRNKRTRSALLRAVGEKEGRYIQTRELVWGIINAFECADEEEVVTDFDL
jgi:hypothetical protein